MNDFGKQKKKAPPSSHRRRVGLLLNKAGEMPSKHRQTFPMFGELPSLAGLLLYPDEHEKMETTTEAEFGPKTCQKLEPMKTLRCNLTLEGERCFNTTNREDYPFYGPDGAVVWHGKVPVRESKTGELRCSLYQQDFSAPKRGRVRRNQVVPHLDNLAINNVLRADYRTVQQEAFPGWDVCVHTRPPPARLKNTAKD
ncbi:hypothetical protein DNTS_035430 [Danionella cerebrum]|nr:hypothetical protein DNTS_035430 [Danionella translucida]TRY54238.1 hypothetical protein DNTS_035430 [Danionella translucida]